MKRPLCPEKIKNLLDAIVARFPQFRAAVLEASDNPDIGDDMQLVVEPKHELTRMPTFRSGFYRELTPMLKARFEYASSIRYGLDVWLNLQQMGLWMRKRAVRSSHRARRTHWIGSPPSLYQDSQLSLFGITLEVPQNATYLVWNDEGSEPRVWSCSGMDAEEHDNLEEYLRSYL